IRSLTIANSLWNFALSGLRAFVVLFFLVGMGRTSSFVATVVFTLVAAGIAVAAPAAGWLADRYGHARLLTGALIVYGVLMAIPGLCQVPWLIVIVPIGAAEAATVLHLPFSAMVRLCPAAYI